MNIVEKLDQDAIILNTSNLKKNKKNPEIKEINSLLFSTRPTIFY